MHFVLLISTVKFVSLGHVEFLGTISNVSREFNLSARQKKQINLLQSLLLSI